MSDWLAEEESLGTWRRELARLKRRARARIKLTVGLAVLATVGALWFMGRRVSPAETRILIRVSESPLLRQDSPLPSGELADYLWDVAFSRQNLDAIIEKHDLYPLAQARGPQFVLETLRDDLDLDVYRNYFLNQRGINDASRTARIVVKYAHKDPETSIRVARDLADLIVATETTRRTRSSLDLAGLAPARWPRRPTCSPSASASWRPPLPISRWRRSAATPTASPRSRSSSRA